MKKFILLAFVLVSCTLLTRAPRREIVSTADTIIYFIQFPEVVSVGDEVEFKLMTEPGNSCFGFIWYKTKLDSLIDYELEVITAGDNGICTWKWIVPDDADNGKANIDGFVSKNGEYTSFLQQYFCISECP